MLNEGARRDIEIGALKLILNVLIGRIIMSQTFSASGANDWLNQFREQCNSALNGVTLNVDNVESDDRIIMEALAGHINKFLDGVIPTEN